MLHQPLLDVVGRLRGESKEVDDAVVRPVHEFKDRQLAQKLGVGREQPYLRSDLDFTVMIGSPPPPQLFCLHEPGMAGLGWL